MRYIFTLLADLSVLDVTRLDELPQTFSPTTTNLIRSKTLVSPKSVLRVAYTPIVCNDLSYLAVIFKSICFIIE
jgi:hypothetical protein